MYVWPTKTHLFPLPTLLLGVLTATAVNHHQLAEYAWPGLILTAEASCMLNSSLFHISIIQYLDSPCGQLSDSG